MFIVKFTWASINQLYNFHIIAVAMASVQVLEAILYIGNVKGVHRLTM